jgi:hypothetical protein
MSFTAFISFWLPWLILLQCQSMKLPTEIDLYAKQKWYLEAPALVSDYDGLLLISTPTTGPEGRVHAVRLMMKEGEYWIYDPDRKISESLSKKTVLIEGKLVTDSLSGIVNELWPGRMWVK